MAAVSLFYFIDPSLCVKFLKKKRSLFKDGSADRKGRLLWTPTSKPEVQYLASISLICSSCLLKKAPSRAKI